MTDYNSLYQHGLYLSPDQQDLLLAALSSNNPPAKQQNNSHPPASKSDPESTPGTTGSYNMSPAFDPSNPHSGGLGYGDDESPFLDFNPELDFDFQGSENLIGDIPDSLPQSEEPEPGEKRKDIDGDADENEASGKKRRESDEKAAKKPGRKPLTSEPTSKRKAQNRAAQRAFRERKEKHLKDLETKVDELQKASDNANQENGLLRAQIDRLQVELREYRKRLSWLTTGTGVSAMNAIPGAYPNSKGSYGLQNNDFMFDFPKFGDLPGSHIFNNGQLSKTQQSAKGEPSTATPRNDSRVPGVVSRNSLSSSQSNGVPAGRTPSSVSQQGSTPASTRKSTPKVSIYNGTAHSTSTHDSSTTDSPSSSSDSHQSQSLSSNGTSPEPTINSPATKAHHNHGAHDGCTYTTIDGEESFCAQLGMACGNINNPIPAVRHNSQSASNTPSQEAPHEDVAGLDMLAQQNGGQFDPVLFGDWREPQDAILSQDFGTFFDDAFPLPDLGSPSHNLTEAATQQPPKKDLIAEIDSKLDEEVVPGEDKSQMLSCTKIWDRLQSMERFRNGELDVDHLCSELRMKARCSEGGVVVNQQDVDDIMGRAK
ncbi:transcription factor PAP1-domain-containing protein [Aspergillus welwitschiae]|uniref:Transcription factor PAP1-domain-containing protein n=1 Tax=Aspergillus welwitschiae TaxID=1341132 RepID=A0A3F3QB54_9EURO|nr:transcription factor PAP1-domain-containing protein [Aspergillus welwitschiae]RDH36349.1 transcription factor PAP1-domain-containing protein [Aspergillus welwitschiae]